MRKVLLLISSFHSKAVVFIGCTPFMPHSLVKTLTMKCLPKPCIALTRPFTPSIPEPHFQGICDKPFLSPFADHKFPKVVVPGRAQRLVSHQITQTEHQLFDAARSTMIGDVSSKVERRTPASQARIQTFPISDVFGLHGMGGYYLHHLGLSPAANQAFSKRFNTRLSIKHIDVKEMAAVLHALTTWLPLFAGCNLTIYGDNAAVVAGINKTSMRGGAMLPLRRIALLAAAHDICSL